jgi:hypothetical protein
MIPMKAPMSNLPNVKVCSPFGDLRASSSGGRLLRRLAAAPYLESTAASYFGVSQAAGP